MNDKTWEIMTDRNSLTPKELAEFYGRFSKDEAERGWPIRIDGAESDKLCDGIAELIEERDKFRTERDNAMTEMLTKNAAAADALNWLWKDIILSKYPEYGEWDYPNQAARFIKEEYDKLNTTE